MESAFNTPDHWDELVSLRDSLRIKQRLGQLSANKTMQEYLFPVIINMGSKKYSPSELLTELLAKVSEVTCGQNMPLSESFIYQYVGRIIEAIVDCDEEDKQKLFDQLRLMAEERSFELGQEINSDFLLKKNKLPRKRKKIQKSTLSSLKASQRAAELDVNGSRHIY